MRRAAIARAAAAAAGRAAGRCAGAACGRSRDGELRRLRRALEPAAAARSVHRASHLPADAGADRCGGRGRLERGAGGCRLRGRGRAARDHAGIRARAGDARHRPCAGCARRDRGARARSCPAGLPRPLARTGADAVPLRHLGRLRYGRAHRHHLVELDRLPAGGEGRADRALHPAVGSDRSRPCAAFGNAPRHHLCPGAGAGFRGRPLRAFRIVGGGEPAHLDRSAPTADALAIYRPDRGRGAPGR